GSQVGAIREKRRRGDWKRGRGDFEAPGFQMSPGAAIRTVVDAGDFAELERVEDDANVAVVGEPEAVILKRCLVAVASAPGRAADVDDRRQLTPPGPPFQRGGT